MSVSILKTESTRYFISLILSIAAQFTVCSLLWHFCCNQKEAFVAKKMNVQLILPIDELEDNQIQANVSIPEEENLEMLQKPQDSEQIMPEDPFETPLKIDKPIIVEKPKPEVKKKKVIKPEPIKKIEKTPEVKPVVSESVNVVEAPVSLPVVSQNVQKKVVASPKPVLTRAQQNENSKYLAKVMKILEKNKKYSEEARRKNLHGKIIVSFAITKDGKTEKVKARTTTPKELANAAEQLIRDAKLPNPPACWPIGASVEIPISYKIK